MKDVHVMNQQDKNRKKGVQKRKRYTKKGRKKFMPQTAVLMFVFFDVRHSSLCLNAVKRNGSVSRQSHSRNGRTEIGSAGNRDKALQSP